VGRGSAETHVVDDRMVTGKEEIDELSGEAENKDPNVEKGTPKVIVKSCRVSEAKNKNETANNDAVVE
jgi:hypothetical protein